MTEIAGLIEDHELLKTAYTEALKQYPTSWSVKRPFDPKQRALIGTEPTREQQVMIDWRNRLSGVLERLAQCFRRLGREYRLREFPLIGCESPRFWDCDDPWVITALDAHLDELQLESRSLEASDSRHSESSLGELLRWTRTKRGQTLEQAAEQFNCDPSTVSRIERGSHPHPGLATAVREYCESDC